MSARSPDGVTDSDDEEGEEVVNEDDGGRSSDEGSEDDEGSLKGTSGSLGGNRPFILPKDWAVNKFLPTMKMESAKIRAQVRAVAARKKGEEKGEGTSSSLPKAVIKNVAKRKVDGRDERPPKKPSVGSVEGLLKKPLPTRHGVGKGLMTAHGPVGHEDERRLLTHEEYAVEKLESIFREKDADPCVDYGEVKDLKGKLEEEGHQVEQEREARVTAEKELTALLGQVETAKVDAVTEFKASQSFIDSCAEYYSDGFEDCLM
ncbi:hypothetical protein SO802_021124 [Lithocarpus litseifolius]|uniref:Uncharacterized protein n=1 Tax=Lithocarpus litseifolius TaxID=425828 RepID=A0AAW2CG10_9ROSI